MFKKELGNSPAKLCLRFLFVAVVMCFIVPLVYAADESPNPIPNPGRESQPLQNSGADITQKTNDPKTSSKGHSSTDSQTSTPISNQDAQESHNQPSQSSSSGWTWDAMTLLTLALIVVGMTQALIYYRQARLMREGLEITKRSADAAQDSADAAKQGAKAAKESAAVARETLQVTQRAYLGIENWRFKNDDAGIPLRIECTLFNSGATPAEIIGSSFKTYVTGELPPPPDYSQITIDPMKPLLIHPKREHTYSVKLASLLKNAAIQDPTMDTIMQLMGTPALTTDLLKRVLQGTSPLYLGGCLVYKPVGLCQMLVLFIQYEAALNQFAAIGESVYNYETPCNDTE